MWEGIEHAQAAKQDFLIFKIDFEKAYDRLEWDFVLQSLWDMGLSRKFIRYVSVLFGNAKARIVINGNLYDPFTLRKSICQGFWPLFCVLLPLMPWVGLCRTRW